MKDLILAAAITCYNYGTITQCTDGTTAYQFGNQTQIISPSNDRATVYQFGNQYQIDSYQSAPVIPVIPPVDSGLRMLEPFK